MEYSCYYNDFFLGVRNTLHSQCLEEKKQKQQDYFHRRVLNAYLQRLRARWEPGENINVKAGDSESLPLGALADGRAGVSLRCSADREGDERKQCARYHLHAEVLLHTGKCWVSMVVPLKSTATKKSTSLSQAVPNSLCCLLFFMNNP